MSIKNFNFFYFFMVVCLWVVTKKHPLFFLPLKFRLYQIEKPRGAMEEGSDACHELKDNDDKI
jgi:hypothetical protein